jgi:hypothetical protein
MLNLKGEKMKNILKISITAATLAFTGNAFAQERDTTSYQGTYNQGDVDDNYNRQQEPNTEFHSDTTMYDRTDTQREIEETENWRHQRDPNSDYRSEELQSDEVRNQNNSGEQFPMTPSDRGTRDSDVEGMTDSEGTLHDQSDAEMQEGRDQNKDYSHDGDQSYNTDRPAETGIGSDPAITPSPDEAHRQAEQDLSHATDTLNYASDRQQNPDKAGRKVEQMADTVDSKVHEKDKRRHGLSEVE